MNDAAIMAAGGPPPPPRCTVRLLWLGLGRWERTYLELPGESDEHLS